jgi:succinate dehydrogenase / fumarate reductase, cytochrome b subunit
MATTMERPGSSPVHPRPKRPAPWPVAFYRSAVGKKWVMALTGIMLIGFVFFHALGNLKVYLGAEDVNHYGEWLRELLVPFLPRTVTLWLLRVGLIAAFAFHIHAAASLTLMNRRARAENVYISRRDWQAANAASRSMRYTGVVVLLFIIFHLSDLSWGTTNPDYVRGDVYRNMVASFDRPLIAAVYVVANLALGLHLFHGSWSLFQSLGLNNPKWNSWRRSFAIGFAVVITLGNLSFPIAVQTGILNADDNDDCQMQGNRIVSCELYEDEAAATQEEATP